MYWLGLVLCLIGTLWIVVNAFRTSVLWGIGSLVVPFVALIFAIMNFADNKIPLLLSVVGAVLMFMGMGSLVEQAAMQGAIEGMPQ